MTEKKKAEVKPVPVVLKERKAIKPFIRTGAVEQMTQSLAACKKLNTHTGEAVPIGDLSQSLAKLAIAKAGKKQGCVYKVGKIAGHPELLQVWKLTPAEVKSIAERAKERQEKKAAFEKLSPAEKSAHTKKLKDRAAKAKATRDKNKKKVAPAAAPIKKP